MTPASQPPSTHPTLLAKIAHLENGAAWRRFVDGYGPFIDERCRMAGLNASEAEDVTQIVLSSLVRALPGFRYDPMKRFRGYLARVVLNATRTYWRKKSRRPECVNIGIEELENIADPAFAGPFASAIDDRLTLDLELLNKIIELVQDRVEPHTWTAYWETAIQGHKPADVALRLGVSAATVYMAKKRVGEMIRDEASRFVTIPPK